MGGMADLPGNVAETDQKAAEANEMVVNADGKDELTVVAGPGINEGT